MEDELLSTSIIKDDEEIVGVVEEVFYGSTLQRLEELAEENSQGDQVIPVESVEMYEIIAKIGPDALHKEEAIVSTKYKTVEKKVKPAARPLPVDSEQKRKKSREIQYFGSPWISDMPSRMGPGRNFGSVEEVSSCKKKKKNGDSSRRRWRWGF